MTINGNSDMADTQPQPALTDEQIKIKQSRTPDMVDTRHVYKVPAAEFDSAFNIYERPTASLEVQRTDGFVLLIYSDSWKP
jgi:hypothetical protein